MSPSKFLIASAALLAAQTVNAFVPQQASFSFATTTYLKAEPETEAATTPVESNKGEDDDEQPIYFNILSEDTPEPIRVSTESELSDAALAASAKIANSYTNGANSGLPTLNGWTPKPDYALYGLPGAIAPLGFFDPIGFARQGLPLNDAKRLREAEVQHSRVAMLAVVGYFSGEAMNLVGGGPFHISGPANDQLQQMPAIPFALLTLAIGSAEIYRAKRGWVQPKAKIGSETLFTLREDYYPGDLGFDPLGLKPTKDYDFQVMQTKELSNGRLAMLAWAGICSQELVNHRTVGETLDFYFNYYLGGN